jgi:hypothetical protein
MMMALPITHSAKASCGKCTPRYIREMEMLRISSMATRVAQGLPTLIAQLREQETPR